ncbi:MULTISPECIES: hypothetical protein [unclassified Acinetobacter]|uniref:hypothetical protein n=1 Tax=unclassified Acinetobacter TaxID=196816 RepID=UPI00244A85A5|nr:MULTISPECIES: hypothetical protein [unclassified Acinetobacter]MDH0032526.1 hypothetical protein [Acinetobacter sp. GD04021]MDH0885217.1 hypothetical protein [Acinetobacter sp. GD03873]MDH1084455.1 hypothetical protein [Acinetobacter sp. GD03983]MDH2188343.1 hypothetical protein [Acinetobacter sp. GD03645]MDH2203854.1 hypothetical protein [Acinetobacter sp. GD03647]
MGNANNQDNSNMALWHSVCITDPTQTTEIKGKPYKGTSPKAYWLIQRATETFGPIGQGWGVDIKDHGFQKLDDVTICHWIIIVLWYMKNGQKCCVEQSGGSKAMYKASTGMVYDEDAIKKSKTNATVKALSLLGFAGDIHAGYWNAPGYQQRAREYYYGPINNAANDTQAQTKQQPPVNQAQNVPDGGQQNEVVSKPKRTEQQIFNDALKAICHAPDTSILDAALNHFKGTQYEKPIVDACKNKKAHAGWGCA